MPQRFLRPGLRNSARWNSVSWEAQSFYIRLITLVDDYGRYDGRPSVLWGECFAVWNELHPDQCVELRKVHELLQQLAASSLIEHYSAEGKQVLQITQWQERVREGSRCKWPGNPNPQQPAATCSEALPPTPSPSPSPSPSTIDHSGVGSEAFPLPEPYNTPELIAVWCKWLRFRKEIHKKVTPTAAQDHIALLQKWGPEVWTQSIGQSISAGWQGLFEPKATTSKPASGFVLQKERERVETQIQAIQRETQEYKWLNTPERQEELKRLQARRADLEAKIAKAL